MAFFPAYRDGIGCFLQRLLLSVCVSLFPKAGEMRSEPKKLLLLLPGFLDIPRIWGAAFFYDWDSGKPHNPEWMIWVVGAAVALFGLTWIFLLFKLKGARIVTLLFGIWNLYFVLMMGLIAVMSLSGGWI
ncbi:MAG: hypothetical protein R3C58_11625 [Parvularculaceae bacterium]